MHCVQFGCFQLSFSFATTKQDTPFIRAVPRSPPLGHCRPPGALEEGRARLASDNEGCPFYLLDTGGPPRVVALSASTNQRRSNHWY